MESSHDLSTKTPEIYRGCNTLASRPTIILFSVLPGTIALSFWMFMSLCSSEGFRTAGFWLRSLPALPYPLRQALHLTTCAPLVQLKVFALLKAGTVCVRPTTVSRLPAPTSVSKGHELAELFVDSGMCNFLAPCEGWATTDAESAWQDTWDYQENEWQHIGMMG